MVLFHSYHLSWKSCLNTQCVLKQLTFVNFITIPIRPHHLINECFILLWCVFGQQNFAPARPCKNKHCKRVYYSVLCVNRVGVFSRYFRIYFNNCDNRTKKSWLKERLLFSNLLSSTTCCSPTRYRKQRVPCLICIRITRFAQRNRCGKSFWQCFLIK